MEKQPRRALSAAQREEIRKLRHESRAASTYKDFLWDVQHEASVSEEMADRAAVSVVRAIERRVIPAEAAHLDAQLPARLREHIRERGVQTSLLPREIGREELLRMVADDLSMKPAEAVTVIRAVFRVLSAHVTPGQMGNVLGQLPADIRSLLWSPGLEQVPAPLEAHVRVAQLIDELLELPPEAQLGALRTLAPRILHRLSRERRQGFLRDLNQELEREDHGEPAHDITAET